MVEDLIAQVETSFAELGGQMTEPAIIGDRERYAEVGREVVA
jgi:peptide chain release factor 1